MYLLAQYKFRLCKIGLIVLLVFCAGKSFSQLSDTENIPVLTFDFFKGVPKADSPYASVIFINHKYFYTVREQKDDGTVLLDVKINALPDSAMSFFDRSRVKDTEVEELVNHERGHLIIGYLIGNLLRKTLNAAIYTSNYREEIKALFTKYHQEYGQLQTQYDDETNHGTNRGVQKLWNVKVRQLYLTSLDGQER